MPQCSMASIGLLCAPRENAAVCIGAEGGTDFEKDARALQLSNPSNQCYANTIVICFLWASSHKLHMQVMRNDALIACLQGHYNNSSVALWNIPSRQAMTRDWERPRTQHDIGEFLLFLYATWPAMHVLCQGRWEARRQDTHVVRILDSGGACPIFFMESLEAGNWNACSMTACIQQWHMHASLHALQSEAAAPQILCLQIDRFACRTGSYDKSRAKFHADNIIGMPAFRQDLDVIYISYQLMACGVHLGTRPHNGHYRAALYDARGTCWMCEDGVKACKANIHDWELCECNSYVFFYRKL